VLIGGSNQTIELQPVSLQGQDGLNVAAGITGIELRYLRSPDANAVDRDDPNVSGNHASGCAKCARGEGHKLAVLTVSYPGAHPPVQSAPRARRRGAAFACQLSKA
jgi:Protein of unknown function (DUF992)